MERIKEYINNNQKNILVASAVAGTAALGYYGVRKYQLSSLKFINDQSFHEQTIPLFATEAVFREKALANVNYDLLMMLSNDAQYYEGRVKISFQVCEKVTKEELNKLFIDFHGETIYEMTVNGVLVGLAEIKFERHRLYIPPNLLFPNSLNSVTIKFQNTYVTNSAGLNRYVDPKDNEVYIYSHLEPFYCNRWFPCFDQPSIRAPLKLIVITPNAKWLVIGNQKKLFTSPLNANDSQQILNKLGSADFMANPNIDVSSCLLHAFEETPPISTFVYGVFIGRFKVFMSNDNERIPMRIYATQSKSQYVDAAEMFRITQAGIHFYEEFFGMRFPFSKYDQIFAPDLKIAAMENVGAVSFAEQQFLKPEEELSEFQKFRFAYIVLHELSHMWFGNLVTMKWWNDVWLKESFADYMSGVCISECEELKNYKNSDLIFARFLDHSLSADVLSTTHPIVVNVKHTIDAVNAFDDICYEKGASFIKVLSNYIGREALKNGTREYFAKYKFQETEMKDFLECLQKSLNMLGSNQYLTDWAQGWLTKAGVNEITAHIEKDVINQSFKVFLKQNVPKNGDPTFHEQKMDVGFYYHNAEDKIISNIHLRANNIPQNIFEGSLEQLPDGIFVNVNNKGYCRTILDEQSVRFFLGNIHKIQGASNRFIMWRTLFDQIKLFKIKPRDFIESVLTNFQAEEVEMTVIMILDKVGFSLRNYFNFVERFEFQQKFFDCIMKKIEMTKENSLKHTLTASLLDVIATEDKLDLLLSWLDKGYVSNEIGSNIMSLTKQLRYLIIRRIYRSSRFSKEGMEKYLLVEKARDFSDIDILNEYALKACLGENKENLWSHFIANDTGMTQQQFKYASKAFYNPENEAECMKFGDMWFDSIENVVLKQHRDYADTFFHNLVPTFLGQEAYLDRFIKILERAIKTENTNFIIMLKEQIELLEEIIQIRNLQQLTVI